MLNAIDPNNITRHSILFFEDAARLLRGHLGSVRTLFGTDRYPETVRQLEEKHRDEMTATRQFQDEINRQLSDYRS